MLERLPEPTDHGRMVVKGRHEEYREFHVTWRWLQDSLEGGARYREADYGVEVYIARWTETHPETGQPVAYQKGHQLPRRNLVRHPQEYPQGAGPGSAAPYSYEGPASTDDEYEFRRALTPVPSFVAEAIGAHLARIYAREVRREAPEGPTGDPLRKWWADVDGAKTTIDDWMQETIAPLFLSLGQIDLAFDHPRPPEGERVESKADSDRLKLSRCIASYILPENLTNWEVECTSKYKWAVVREWHDGAEHFREWTAEGSTLYDARGAVAGEPTGHKFGRVPIVRCFDVRKPRCDNVGQSRYEVNAELQRAYYNVDSELTLANSLAAHPSLSGPEGFCSNQTIHVGPGNILPKKRDTSRGGYEGWEYVCPPSEASDKLSRKLQDYRDQNDRAACLTKPAGASGTTGNTVAQSGVSKMLDQNGGNDLLTKISKALQRLEWKAVEMVLTVLGDKPADEADLEKVTIEYPTRFDLFTAADFAALVGEFQTLTAGATGDLPETTGHLLRTYIRLMMPGMDDETYEQIDEEIDAYLEGQAKRAEQMAEMAPMQAQAKGLPSPDPMVPDELPLDA